MPLLLLAVGLLGLMAAASTQEETPKSDAPAPKLEAPERALVGKKPDLSRADTEGSRGWDALAKLPTNAGPGNAGPIAAGAGPSAIQGGEDLWREASMRFDNPGELPKFNAPPLEQPWPSEPGYRAPVRTAAYTPQDPRPTVIPISYTGNPDYNSAIGMIASLQEDRDRRAVAGGSVSNGSLRNAFRVPQRGFGYEFVNAGTNYTTDELGFGLMHIAAEFKQANAGHPGITFGDASDHNGGALGGHKSHQRGLDVDIYFAVTDANNRPVVNRSFISFDANGRSRSGLRFDDKRNWDLLKRMLESPYFGREVQFVFIDSVLKSRVLRAAKSELDAASGAERDRLRNLYQRANAVMLHEPHHGNHFHLRIKPVQRPLPVPGKTVIV